MNPVVVLILFAGMALVIHSVYEEKYKRLKQEVKVEYRFIPRTLYDEQLVQSDVSGHFRTMFDAGTPWYGEAVTSMPGPSRPSASRAAA
jgi:hypothetical protein